MRERLILVAILGNWIPGIDLMVVRRTEEHGEAQKDAKRKRRWTCGTRHARRKIHTADVQQDTRQRRATKIRRRSENSICSRIYVNGVCMDFTRV
jgi:hypothetical protein